MSWHVIVRFRSDIPQRHASVSTGPTGGWGLTFYGGESSRGSLVRLRCPGRAGRIQVGTVEPGELADLLCGRFRHSRRGAVGARKTHDVNVLEDRDNLPSLWDLRVDVAHRGRAIGCELRTVLLNPEPDWPEEHQLLWYLKLNLSPP